MTRLKFAGFGVFCLLSIATLVFLGNWQVQRLAWKTQIIERLQAEYARDPATNRFTFKGLQELGAQDQPIVRGRAFGRLNFDKQIRLGPKTLNGQIGHHIITPFRLGTGGIILVNRGFAPKDRKLQTGKQNRIWIDGIARKPDWNSFSSGNAPAKDIWIKPDITEIAVAKNLPLENVVPVMLYAQAASVPFEDTVFLDQNWMPRNNHKQYAIFWFSMAGIFALFFGYAGLKFSRSQE